MFAARISRGRTLKGLILGQLLGGTLGCWVAFTIFGNTGLYAEVNNLVPVLDILQNEGAPAAIIAILTSLPIGTIVMVIYLGVMAIFLATTVNSAAFTLADVASVNLERGEEPVRWYRVFWDSFSQVSRSSSCTVKDSKHYKRSRSLPDSLSYSSCSS